MALPPSGSRVGTSSSAAGAVRPTAVGQKLDGDLQQAVAGGRVEAELAALRRLVEQQQAQIDALVASLANVVRQDLNGRLLLPTDLRLEIRAANATLTFEPARVTISSPTSIELQSSTVRVAASAVTLNSAMVQAVGVLKCANLIATSVVAASYSPGAGNIW